MVSMIRAAACRRLGTVWLPSAFAVLAALSAAWQPALAGGIGDFNGDDRDDVLLRHSDGRWYYYPMNGRRHLPEGRGIANLTRNPAWTTAGTGDFDGDGRDDVLLRHSDGRWYYYPMNGRRHLPEGRGAANLTRNPAWSVAGTGDFNGDGRDDVLLRHSDGRWYYYPMDGRRHLPEGRGIANLTRNPAWSVAGTGDFNGDGRDDVLLRHSDGRWYYYPMDGRRHLPEGRGIANLTRNPAWSIAGTGDFDGDGRDDVLLRHSDGRWYYYPMDGRRHLPEGRGIANLTRNPAWSVAGTGDFDGDGRDDVLLRHSDGRWYYYPMNGRRHISGQEGNAELSRNRSWRLGGGGDREPGETFRDSLSSGGEGPLMAVIPAGSFRQGCLNDDGECLSSEKPVREVRVDMFALGVHEVTFADYDRFAEATGSSKPDDEGWGRGDRPVVNVGWDDAKAYAAWLSEETGALYRLPSESEWEYAARSGTQTKYHWGDEIGSNRANCRDSDCEDAFRYTSPVGSFAPNDFGLHDMHGNVWEWVEDCWNSSYEDAPADGSAWQDGNCFVRVLRGGSWSGISGFLRSSMRFRVGTSSRNADFGFRVARRVSSTQ